MTSFKIEAVENQMGVNSPILKGNNMLINTYLMENRGSVYRADVVNFFGFVYVDLFVNEKFKERFEIPNEKKSNSDFIESYAQNIIKIEVGKKK